jgi:phosphoribosylaminoimidazole-succinocarboxamide synthase
MKEYQFPGQTGYYKGKVRDVYYIDNQFIILITSNRISAFDVILPREIPFKGQVLNQIAAKMLKATAGICPNWLLASPAPNVSIGRNCKPFRIEMVVRGNLTGHAWRSYQQGKRELCGAPMPDGLKEFDFFPEPIITPSTKAEAGHDEDISAENIVSNNLATKAEWEVLSRYALQLFEKGKELAAAKGLILADTKYEFGKIGNEIYLMDEVHTPDSSRYFYQDGFEERQQRNEKQKQLSKEFVREWLIENDFMGKPGQTVPEMNDERVTAISKRYIELYEQITGETFVPETITEAETEKRIIESVLRVANF